MGFDSIIALDLGKFNSVVCFLDARTRRHRFETLVTTPRTLHDLFTRHTTADPQRTLVVVEDRRSAKGRRPRLTRCVTAAGERVAANEATMSAANNPMR